MAVRLTAKKLEDKGRVTGAKFAELAGVTRQNINNLRSKGELTQGEDGLYDLTDPKNMLYLANPRNRKANSDAQTHREDTEYEGTRNTKEALELEKLQEQTYKIRLENQKRRGELIPRELVHKYIAKVHAIDQTQLHNLGIDLSPKIAALCGINDESKELEIQAKIEDAIYRVTDSAKRMMDKFLKDLKIEESE